jgi:hypothetical protein
MLPHLAGSVACEGASGRTSASGDGNGVQVDHARLSSILVGEHLRETLMRTRLRLRLNPAVTLRPAEHGFVAWSPVKREFVPLAPGVATLLELFTAPQDVDRALAAWPGAARLTFKQRVSVIQSLVRAGLLTADGPRQPAAARAAAPAPQAPAFIIGCPRSGTTLVRWFVDAHPELTCPPELKIVPHLKELLARPTFFGGLRSLLRDEEAIFRRLRDFVDGVMQDHTRYAGKRRWVDKTPDNVVCLDFLDRLYAREARYVVIVRHALDVAASLDEALGTGSTPPSFVVESTAPYLARDDFRLLALCKYWRDVNQVVLEFVARHRDRCHVLRYEDLVAAPERHLRDLFAFLDERWHPAILTTAFSMEHAGGFGDPKIVQTRRVEVDRVGRWRDWDPAVLRVVAPTVNETLQRLGYAPLRPGRGGALGRAARPAAAPAGRRLGRAARGALQRPVGSRRRRGR